MRARRLRMPRREVSRLAVCVSIDPARRISYSTFALALWCVPASAGHYLSAAHKPLRRCFCNINRERSPDESNRKSLPGIHMDGFGVYRGLGFDLESVFVRASESAVPTGWEVPFEIRRSSA